MSDIDGAAILRWLHAESAKSGWTGRDRENCESFMAAAYAKGRDDQEDYEWVERKALLKAILDVVKYEWGSLETARNVNLVGPWKALLAKLDEQPLEPADLRKEHP